ncbi:C40 family peptidase [Porphyromonas gulae]|uniref:C40 family peptidase n=1 Tax=Porphyromonas gulae TaxID=111105 RepID=UPI0026F0971B|nr:C40 family peptidase [Porphyromonas gulae]
MKECVSICKCLFRQSCLLLALTGLLYSCGTSKKATSVSGKPHHTTATSHSLRTAEDIVTDLIARGKKLIGKPYRYRGPSSWPMDCSGYVAYLYSCYDIHIPRSSSALYNYTIPVRHPLPGDLLFFRGSKNRKGVIGHVALLIEIRGDELIMLHNTNSRGIIIESLQRSSYFSKRYIRAGRLPEIQALMD